MPKLDYMDPELIKIDHAPFIYESECCTEFFITVYIEFYDWTGITEIKPLTHQLVLEKKGKV